LNLWIYYPLCIPKKNHWSPQTISLITEISKFTDNYKPLYFNSFYSLIVLPFVKQIQKDSVPISFHNLGIIDETALIFDFQIKTTNQKRQIFKTINMSILIENVNVAFYYIWDFYYYRLLIVRVNGLFMV